MVTSGYNRSPEESKVSPLTNQSKLTISMSKKSKNRVVQSSALPSANSGIKEAPDTETKVKNINIEI